MFCVAQEMCQVCKESLDLRSTVFVLVGCKLEEMDADYGICPGGICIINIANQGVLKKMLVYISKHLLKGLILECRH